MRRDPASIGVGQGRTAQVNRRMTECAPMRAKVGGRGYVANLCVTRATLWELYRKQLKCSSLRSYSVNLV